MRERTHESDAGLDFFGQKTLDVLVKCHSGSIVRSNAVVRSNKCEMQFRIGLSQSTEGLNDKITAFDFVKSSDEKDTVSIALAETPRPLLRNAINRIWNTSRVLEI